MTAVAYVLVRGASALVLSIENGLTIGVHTSVNAARTSACATRIPQ